MIAGRSLLLVALSEIGAGGYNTFAFLKLYTSGRCTKFSMLLINVMVINDLGQDYYALYCPIYCFLVYFMLSHLPYFANVVYSLFPSRSPSFSFMSKTEIK